MVGSSACRPIGAPGMPTLVRPVRKTLWPVMNDDAAGGAALLAVGVGEEHAFVGDAVDVGRPVAHQPVAVAAQVRDADVVAPDDEDVRLVGHQAARSFRRAGSARRTMQRKPRWRRRGVDRLRLARRGPVAEAVVRRAEVRAALDHLARDVLARLAGVVALLGRRDARVGRDAARARDARRDGAGRTSRSSTPRRCRSCRTGRSRSAGSCPTGEVPLVAVGLQVLPGELALPGVRHRLAVRDELVAPGEDRALEAAARGELPLRLGRSSLPAQAA